MSAAASPRRPAAAIVGAGLMGRWHLDAANRAGVRVAAVVDADLGRARALARRAGAAAATAIDAIDLAGVDVAHVCTPSETHAAIASRVLEAGCHALVEKPLAASAAETDDLLGLARERGALLCPVHQFLFQTGTLRAAERLPDMGRIVHVRATVCSAGADDEPDTVRDRVAGEIVIHPLSLLARLFGWPPADLPWSASRPAAGEIRASARVEQASIDLTVSMRARPTVNALEILAERGTARLDLFHGFAVFEGGEISRTRKALRPFDLAARTIAAGGVNLARRAAARETAFPGLRALVRGFYDAVEGGAGEGPIAPAETLAVARARDALLDRVEGP